MNRLAESEKNIYKVDYHGQMNQFDGAKENYAEGTEVEISYSLIATDTNYTFYVDGQEACVEWNGKKGYIIRFTMPAHDIEVYCNEKNLMACCQAAETQVIREEVLNGTEECTARSERY